MSTLEIDQTIKELETNGYAVINKYLSNTVELINFKHKFYELVCIKAKQYNVKIPVESSESINQSIMELDAINNKIGAFLNDALNTTPELFQLLNSEKFLSLAKAVIGEENGIILANNHCARIQIPGHDDISNLPWHQDSHYNNFYKYKNSIVIWTSISDINEEAGPIVFKKGSQILKKLPKEEYKKSNNQIVYTLSDEYTGHPDFPECTIQTKSGDTALIDMNTIHRSGENKSTSNVKLSVQCRYHNASKIGFLPHYN